MASPKRDSRLFNILWQRLLSLIQRARSSTKRLNLSGRARQARRVSEHFLSVRRNRQWSVAIVVIILISTLAGVVFYLRRRPKTTYYIAYVGRYQRPGFDELHERVLRKYLHELNAETNGARFELRSFSTRVNDKTNDSSKAYKEISANGQYVIVIDNTWGSHLSAVAEVIKDNRIPIISLNADKQQLDSGNQIVFIGYDDDVPEKLLAFNKQFLRSDQTILIAEREFSSTNIYLKELPDVHPLYVTDVNINPAERSKLFSDLKQRLEKEKSFQGRRTIIVNTHANWGNEILDHIRNSDFKALDILGGPFITNKRLDEVKLSGDNRLILLTNRKDAITKGVRHELESIKGESPQLAAFLSVELFVERCLSALSLIRAGVSDALAREHMVSREGFIRFFEHRLRDKAVVSDGELYSFENGLLLRDERTFEQYVNGEWSSYPRQLNSSKKAIPNIYVGLDDICISSIDTRSRSFHADFLYWLKYDDPNINPKEYLVFRNQKTAHEESIVSVKGQGNSGVYQLFKMSGEFELNVDLERYPFDKQEARIELAAIYPREKLRVSFDHASFRRTESFERTKDERCQVYGVDEWTVGQRYVTVDNIISTSLGGGTDVADRKLQKHELLNVRTPVARRRTGPLVTIILPLWLIGLAAVGLLFVKDSSFANIGEVCLVVFLTIVTYSIGLAPIVHRANVLTVADKVFFGTFLTVFLVFFKVVAFNSDLINQRVQTWVDKHAGAVGTAALGFYSFIMVLALSGKDVSILKAITRGWPFVSG